MVCGAHWRSDDDLKGKEQETIVVRLLMVFTFAQILFRDLNKCSLLSTKFMHPTHPALFCAFDNQNLVICGLYRKALSSK